MTRLILDRNYDERQIDITMPDGRVIEVFIVDVSWGAVRLAITAPADVKVLRHELTERDRTNA